MIASFTFFSHLCSPPSLLLPLLLFLLPPSLPPLLPPVLSLDAMDVSGSHQLDLSHHIHKRPLDRFGEVIGQEVKHELGDTLKEAHVKEYAQAVNANLTAGQTPVPSPEPLTTPPTPPAVDPTKVPGYCGPCYGSERECSPLEHATRMLSSREVFVWLRCSPESWLTLPLCCPVPSVACSACCFLFSV